MRNLYRRVKKRCKLAMLYFLRIVFVKNKFKVSLYKKIKANFLGGFLADQWVLYDFDKNDKREYLSEFDWYRSRYINEPFNCLLNNKVIASEVLQQYVKVAKNYVIKNKGVLTDCDSYEIITYEQVVELVKHKGKVFIKPFDQGMGKGVHLLTCSEEGLCIDRNMVEKEEIIDFLKRTEDWFISEAIEQADYVNKIYDKTTNTIRIITIRDIQTKEFKVFFAVHRIGTKATIPVDNGSRGGLVSKIDLETGRLSEARSLHSLAVYEKHPDSGVRIKGVVVPNWGLLKENILLMARKLPYMHFIAWDVLITKEGISIVEANTSSGVNIIQLWGGQRNGELGNFYRYHKVIK